MKPLDLPEKIMTFELSDFRFIGIHIVDERNIRNVMNIPIKVAFAMTNDIYAIRFSIYWNSYFR